MVREIIISCFMNSSMPNQVNPRDSTLEYYRSAPVVYYIFGLRQMSFRRRYFLCE